jgi:hypothetical protein
MQVVSGLNHAPGWVGPKSCSGVLENRNISCPYRDSNLGQPSSLLAFLTKKTVSSPSKNEFFSFQCSGFLEGYCSIRRFPSRHSLVLMVTAALCCSGGMIPIRENRIARRKTFSSVTLSTTNLTWTGCGLNPVPRSFFLGVY